MLNGNTEGRGRELRHIPIELGESNKEIEVWTRFEEVEHRFISSMLELLDEVRRARVEAILTTFDEIRLAETELQEILREVKLAVEEIRDQGVRLAGLERAMEVVEGPDINTKTRLKLTIPIIPFLLYHESELELSNKQELTAIWERIIGE